MTCETCSFNCIDSCKFYNNKNTTHLLCIFKQLPNDIIYFITEFLYHYHGHKVFHNNELYLCYKYKTLCTSCFQLGYYKLMNSPRIIHSINIMRYFDCWVDDDCIDTIQSFCFNSNIPSVMNILIYYDIKLKSSNIEMSSKLFGSK